jgi:hypothetical protein
VFLFKSKSWWNTTGLKRAHQEMMYEDGECAHCLETAADATATGSGMPASAAGAPLFSERGKKKEKNKKASV